MAYGIDLDKAISTDDFKCLKKKGYRAAFVRAYDPSGAGKFDDSARHNFYNAKKAGLMTEMFMIPNPRSAKSGKTQFMELYKGLTANGIDVNRVFVQVTSPKRWGDNTQKNVAFLKEIIKAANQKRINIGVYTNHYEWSEIMDGAKIEVPYLWYWNTNGDGQKGETPADFGDFVTFGKFGQTVAKQFGKKVNICGVLVNRNVFHGANDQRSPRFKFAKSWPGRVF
ncbi:hypothetical protein OESDEN_16661 [Oesophagostomum dentatum]|uniref:Glycosyl hydrolase family 25 n=1 Tax=Oesophagostomum dentatum TaxID=61180 RepID=A0A0B1SEE0_OESDE|nr:hypothetical protein OESDEN_16661 [Oesophagostomum dentatum]